MNLIYLSGGVFPSKQANSIHIIKMCSAFASQGHQVVLLGKRGVISDNIFEYYNVRSNFKIILNDFSSSIFNNVNHGIWLYSNVKRLNPDFFYGRHILGLFLSSFLKFPFGIELHYPPNDKIKYSLLKILFKKANLRKIVVISKSLKFKLLEEFSLNSDLIEIAHDAANSRRSLPKRLEIFKIKKIAYSGSFNPGKGVDFVLKLANLLPEYEFHLFGGTKEDYSPDCVIPINVKFRGYLSQNSLFSELIEMDLLLAPYKNKVFGNSHKTDLSKWMSPLKIFEYMSLGIPIVASDHPVIREVLTHRQNSILARPEDLLDWKESILQVLNDISLYSYIANNALKDQNMFYTWDSRAIRILSFFQI